MTTNILNLAVKLACDWTGVTDQADGDEDVDFNARMRERKGKK